MQHKTNYSIILSIKIQIRLPVFVNNLKITKSYQDRDMVKNGFVFAHEDAKNTKAEAREKTGRARNAAVPAGAPFRCAGQTCRTGRIGGAHCFGHGSTTLFQRKLLLQNS
ncbi:hypothetical protein NEIFLAOT_00314 [Neisseria flavescens NRL30031/H210]|uniref:Uncharacterized protein n=1 Tax=Neisseria flavescens NRL30031/H210 TaxID=546264 RepID=C0EK72_NEIFL|nr:hypothetical protein NEIFLAOT_00314 [Neisseria flavescens NRL30031/H210]